MPMTRETDELSMSDYLDMLRRRGALVLVTAAVLGLGAYLWSNQQTRLYRAESQVLVDFESSTQYVDPNGAQGAGSATNPQRRIENELRFADGQVVLGALED